MADRHLFGTDGVRGVANEGLTPETAFDLARAAGEGRDGHVVVGEEDAEEGLARLAEEEFDVVLSDWRMSGMSGAEFYGEIRRRFPHLRGRISP